MALLRSWVVWALGLACLAGTGCGPREQVASYKVPKESLLSAANRTGTARVAAGRVDGMWGAIILRPNQGWFFKGTGAAADVAAARKSLNEFLQGVTFTAEGEPQWKLPEGWKQEAGSGLRFATLRTSDPAAVEISVTSLPNEEADSKKYVLENVNRWRNQVGLAPLAANELSAQSETVELGNSLSATVVFLEGIARGGGGPMAGGSPSPGGAAEGGPGPEGALPPGHPPVAQRPSEQAAATASDVKFTPPSHWEARPGRPFTRMAFVVREGEKQVEITLSELSTAAASAGELLPNVNRWRDQLGLEPIAAGELESQVIKIEMGSQPGHLVELLGGEGTSAGGEREALYAAMAIMGRQAWFVKLRGPQSLAERERESFRKFVTSLQFASGTGENDGQ